MIDALRRFRNRAPRRLEARIALAIILAVSTIVLLTLAVLLFIPHGRFTAFQRGWLVETVRNMIDKVSEAPPEARVSLISTMAERQWFFVDWTLTMPSAPQRPPPPPHLDQRLEHDIAAGLDKVQFLHVSLTRRRPRSTLAGDNAVSPMQGDRSLRSEPDPARRDRHARGPFPWLFSSGHVLTIVPPPAATDAPESQGNLVPAIFDIAVRLKDGSWLHITPRETADPAWILELVLPLIGSAVVVAVLSVLTARRILAPLGTLTTEAQRLGVGRASAPISAKGLEEFASVAHALNDMHARLSGFVDERTQMLAAISHDIRSALTRLRLHVEDVEGDKLKSRLDGEIADMEKMIAATLGFARNDAANEAPAPVDVAALLISITDDHADKGHSATYEGPDHLVMRCQRLAIKRAINNLVDNAVKYGRSVRVHLDASPDCVAIEINDDGPGIPDDQRERVFAPFYRIEASRNRDTGGVGLGLTIVRDIVRAHMGEIALASAPSGGLSVQIKLPRD